MNTEQQFLLVVSIMLAFFLYATIQILLIARQWGKKVKEISKMQKRVEILITAAEELQILKEQMEAVDFA